MTGSIESRVPFAEYRASPGLSVSSLKELKRSPLHYRHRLENPLVSAPLTLGTAAHTATLEPERFGHQFAIWSRRSEKTGNLCPRNGQHWDAFQLENSDKSIITEDECSLALAIGHAVRSDPLAMRYLETGEPEVSMRWEMQGRQCRGRVDWFTRLDDEPYLVGLKTTRDCRLFVFGTQAARLEYALQWAWYFNGYTIIRGQKPKLIEIVVESAPPHAVAVYNIPDDIVLQGEEEYMRLLERLTQCEQHNDWPGPVTEEQVLTLPTWYYGVEDEDLTGLGLEE